MNKSAFRISESLRISQNIEEIRRRQVRQAVNVLETAGRTDVRTAFQQGKPEGSGPGNAGTCIQAYHLGFGKYASKSTRADANAKRVCRIFGEYAKWAVNKARTCRATDIFKLGGHVYAFGSTTIDLCLNVPTPQTT